jgi:PAS domain S-box-containing protein
MTIGSTLLDLLGFTLAARDDDTSATTVVRQFISTKELCDKDLILVDMLNSKGHEHVCFCICDPDQIDMPIVFSSQGFCDFTGYNCAEIEGRNCRFLQGEGTEADDVARIRSCIKEEKEGSINLLNYRKDGTPFINEFFISPLRNAKGAVCYVSMELCLRNDAIYILSN